MYASVNNLETSLPEVNNSLADISSCTVSDIYQLDGNVTYLDDSQIRQAEAELEPHPTKTIPVLVSGSSRCYPSEQEGRLPPVRRTIRRNNLILQSMVLPTVMNINLMSSQSYWISMRLTLSVCRKRGRGKIYPWRSYLTCQTTR